MLDLKGRNLLCLTVRGTKRGEQIANFGKKPLKFIYFLQENDLKIPPPILKNLDNSPPGAFYSTPPPSTIRQLGTKEYQNKRHYIYVDSEVERELKSYAIIHLVFMRSFLKN